MVLQRKYRNLIRQLASNENQADLAATTYKRGENLFQQGVISRQRRDEMLASKLRHVKLLKHLSTVRTR